MEPPSPPFVCPYTVNDYSLTSVIGGGAFSVVYKAQRISNPSEIFAMKIIPKTMLRDAVDQEHLQRELDTMAILKHENIVDLHDFFSDHDYFYLALDYCSGGSLTGVLASMPKLRDNQIANIFKQIVNAVAYCHLRDVAHRDLKPQNILVTQFPNIKLADFGLCGYINTDEKMKTFCGSPCYTAPECLKMTKYDGKKSDVWSLGVILFELATYEHPWQTSNVPKMIQQIQKCQYTVPSSVTPALADLIKSILRVNPNDRLTCEKILAHPWMKLAPSRKRSDSMSLPPLNRYSVPLMANAVDRSGETKDHGVVSPFKGLTLGTPAGTTLTGTVVRSRSNSFSKTQPIVNLQNIAKKDTPGSGLGSRRHVVPIPLPSKRPVV